MARWSTRGVRSRLCDPTHAVPDAREVEARLGLCGVRIRMIVGSGEPWWGAKRCMMRVPWSLPHLNDTQFTQRRRWIAFTPTLLAAKSSAKCRTHSNSSNQAFHCISSSGFSRRFEAVTHIIATLDHRLPQTLDSGINLYKVSKHSFHSFRCECWKHLNISSISTRGYSQTGRSLGKRLVLLPS